MNACVRTNSFFFYIQFVVSLSEFPSVTSSDRGRTRGDRQIHPDNSRSELSANAYGFLVIFQLLLKASWKAVEKAKLKLQACASTPVALLRDAVTI